MLEVQKLMKDNAALKRMLKKQNMQISSNNVQARQNIQKRSPIIQAAQIPQLSQQYQPVPQQMIQ